MTNLGTNQYGDGSEFTLADLYRAMWLAKFRIALLTVVFGILAWLFGQQMPQQFTATALLVADPSYATVSDFEQDTEATFSDPAAIRTVVETISSGAVLEIALRNMPDQIARAVEAAASQSRETTQSDDPVQKDTALSSDGRLRTINHIKRNLSVSNGGRSYLIELDYTAEDPDLAAAVVNSVVSAYLTFRNDRRTDIFRQTLTTIGGRVDDLKEDLKSSERATQQMRGQVQLLERNIERLTGSAREDAMAESAAAYASQREAERETDAIGAVYETFLLRQKELESRIGLPDASVRSLTDAHAPLNSSGPGPSLFAAIGALFGLGVGAAWAVLRYRRRVLGA